MAVQEYLIEEVESLTQPSEDRVEWLQKVTDLNLEGQLQLGNNVPEKGPIPFPLMNGSMTHIFETLCPSKSILKDYNKTAIPLRALALIGLSVQNEYFGKIEIWYDEEELDPIVVGCDGQDKYLLARWADELEEMGVLMEKAIKKKISKRSNALSKKLKEAEKDLATVAEDVRSFMTNQVTYLFD
jgi:hypothetical protein